MLPDATGRPEENLRHQSIDCPASLYVFSDLLYIYKISVFLGFWNGSFMLPVAE